MASWDNFEDTKEYIKQNLRKFHGSEFVEMNIDEIDQKMYSPQYDNVFVDEDESVHLFSNFNNWNSMKMMPFLKYVEVMDKDKPTEEDIVSSIKKKQETKYKERQEKERSGQSVKDLPDIIQVRQKVQNLQDCNDYEKDLFLREYNQYRIQLKQGKWEEVLQKYLKYKKPAILNLDVKELQKPERLYVLPLFIRDGKQYMMFRYDDLRIETCEWVFQRGILDYRAEEIIHFAKEGSSYTVQRKFQKEKSVFDQWKEDTIEISKACLEHDYVFWKIQKMKLETEEKRDIEEVLEKYFSFIKHIFLVLASDSEFPAISMVNLSKFIKTCNIIDKQTRSDRIDQLYLNACGALDPKDSPNKYMYRWSFLEFIFRLAIDRYQDRSKANAVEKLIITNFEPYFKLIDIYEPWQEIRDNTFWTLEVDDVIRNNIKGIKQVFSKFSKQKPTVSSQDVVAVFLNYPKLGINEKQVKFAYGMSKMTVISEFSPAKPYENMKFVEFLEMICRLAIVKYKGQEQESYDFKDKFQLFLEELLALVGQKFVEVELKDEEVSESDQDY